MAKKSERRKLVEKLDNITMLIIRERDNLTCQHCHSKITKSNAHRSHIIPKSLGYVLRWDLKNLLLMCFHCHINWWHKNPLEATLWFKRTYPKRYDYLMLKKNDIVKFSLQDLRDMYVEFKENYLQKV